MKAVEAALLPFMAGNKQFIIPIYQRPYSWTLRQCSQLWNDILNVAKDESTPGHFIGSIVYIAKGLIAITPIPQFLVIDGQQRLTTVSLILSALGKAIEEKKANAEVTREAIEDYYLFNKHGKDDLRYKLLLTQSDRETFTRLIEGRSLPKENSNRLSENYRFFEEQLKEPGIDLGSIYRGLAKLVVVDIALDRQYDNPQRIFESLNSTGLDLSQADLIRNYVLMGLDIKEQESLYKDFWYPMEQSFIGRQRADAFDWFIRDYLTIKTGRIPNIGEVYSSFKTYVQSNKTVSIKSVVADVHTFAEYYAQFAFETAPDDSIKEAVRDINQLKVDVAHPFFLEVFADYHNRRIKREELIEILRLVESYVFRRAVCGIPTNSLNKTFANLSREIDKNKYLESLKAALLLKDSYRRFPTDDEFRAELMVKDVYNFRTRNYLLRKLENYGSKEKVVVENCTIEHIMPQNLTSEWRQELGQDWEAVHSKYLHTLGNLTLTGYNSELSDKPFLAKRDMKGGFAESPLRLNRGLAKLTHWNEEEILKRAAELSELALKVWPAPTLSDETRGKYSKRKDGYGEKVYTLADHPQLRGEVLQLFEQLRTRILNLDASVREEVKKVYIVYKSATNFVDLVPQRKRLRLSLNIPFEEIRDSRGICRDVTNSGRWGNGDVEVVISSASEIDYVMDLVSQAFEKQRDDNGG